jgi:hypothetical protein
LDNVREGSRLRGKVGFAIILQDSIGWQCLLRQSELGQWSRGTLFKLQGWNRDHSPRFDWLGTQAEGVDLFVVVLIWNER